jgi:hypothetical protein
MPGTPQRAADALLCERCGYALEGLGEDPAAACPECGTSVAASLPSSRPGTRWQRAPGAAALLATGWATLRHPGRTFRGAMIEERRARALLRWWLGLSGLIGASVQVHRVLAEAATRASMPWLPNSTLPAPLTPVQITLALLYGVGLSVAGVFVVLWVLTWIEARGIRLFGNRGGWRVTRDVAWVVCAHSAVGWPIAAALAVAGYFAARYGVNWRYEPFAPAVWWEYVASAAPLAGFFVGMLVFETLVWLGVRRCRFANVPGARVDAGAGNLEAGAQQRTGTSPSGAGAA